MRGACSMTYRQLHQALLADLNQAGRESARFDATQLLSHFCRADRAFLLSKGDLPCPEPAAKQLWAAAKRLKQGEPLQYILGSWEFYGLPFAVGPGVLIPRPDTEVVVEKCLALMQAVPAPAVCDLCSGSGAIALALWRHLPGAAVTAVELSPEAATYLRQNIQTLSGGAVQLLLGDVLQPLPLPKYDLIVSNPPYITLEEMQTLSPQVRREPEMALYGGKDGLTFYRGIAAGYYSNLNPGGWLVFEIGCSQQESVLAILQQQGYTNLFCQPDLAGLPRCAGGQRPIIAPGDTPDAPAKEELK